MIEIGTNLSEVIFSVSTLLFIIIMIWLALRS